MMISTRPPWIKPGLALLLSALLCAACGARTAAGPAGGAGPRSGTADLDGLGVYYVDQGRGGAALVFVHGWTCDHTFWRLQQPVFADGRRVILIDLPGHGRSDKPDIAYTQALFSRSVGAVLDRAGVTSAVLVGHSMGFAVVRRFALDRPGLVRALVSADGTMLRVPRDRDKRRAWKRRYDDFTRRFHGPDYERASRDYIRFMFAGETPEALRAEITAKMLATPRHVALSALDHLGDPSVWDDRPVDLPTLAVYAQQAWLPADNERYLRGLFPRLEYHAWTDAGHFVMMDRPERFNRVLSEFLKTLGPASH